MPIEKCTLADCGRLAVLNKELIEDEGHDNPMTVAELAGRMAGFMASEYDAYYFREGGEVVGYALVRHTVKPVYLRHFFICRAQRRKGYGRRFFHELLAELGETAIDIEVLTANEAGMGFWRNLGFVPRSLYMRYEEE
jgi:ribosomal protein S18 acetylase RimI-like enzyme